MQDEHAQVGLESGGKQQVTEVVNEVLVLAREEVGHSGQCQEVADDMHSEEAVLNTVLEREDQVARDHGNVLESLLAGADSTYADIRQDHQCQISVSAH